MSFATIALTRPPCRHCGKAATRSRQLCSRDYNDASIRAMYPVIERQVVPGTGGPAQCMACDATVNQRAMKGLGWKTRRARCLGTYVLDVLCPSCFARWGWPPEVPGGEGA